MEDCLWHPSERRSIKTVFGDYLPRCASDMRSIACDKPFSDPRSNTATKSNSIVIANLIDGVMHVRHPHGGQLGCAHQEMPSAGVVLVVVDGVVPSLRQHPTEWLRKR